VALLSIFQLGTVPSFLGKKDVVKRSVHDSNSNAPTGYVKGAYPLFEAAGQCNLALVMELIGSADNINCIVNEKCVKSTGWTPLHAAVCWDPTLGFEKRRPVIEFLVANGADLSTLTSNGSPIWTLCPRKEPALTLHLINLGMSLIQRCPLTGNTVFHHWASNFGYSVNGDAVAIVKLLLAKGADLNALDFYGFTPLYLSAIGSASNKLRGHPNEPVLRYLLQQEEISASVKIIALELAGAVILLDERSRGRFRSQSFKYWNEAQDLRESVGLIPKVVEDLGINNIPWRATEWTTRTQLEELQNYRHYSSTQSHNREIQAILVSRRILHRISSKAFVHFLWKLVPAENCCSFSDSPDALSLELCWALLEGIRHVTDPGTEDLWEMVVKLNNRLVSTLSKLKSKRSPILNCETLKVSMRLVLDVTNQSLFAFDQENRRVFSNLEPGEPLVTIYQLILLLCQHQEMLTNEMKSCLHQFVNSCIDRDV